VRARSTYLDEWWFSSREPVHKAINRNTGNLVGTKTVDIIIPCYNGASFLSQTIDSALGQTYSPINVLVVDDGSTDHSRKIVESYEGRVGYFYKENGGQASARNAGILRTTGDYVCLLDADDIILPEMIQHMVDYLEERPEVDICHSKTLAFNNDNIHHPYAECWRPFRVWDSYLEPLSVICAIHGSSAVIRRRVFKKFGLFPEDRAIQGCEDWHFWLQTVLQGAVVRYVPTVYTLYRQHSSSSSSEEFGIALRESELIRRAVELFRSHGVAKNRQWVILSYGMKSVALRWLTLGEIRRFRELIELSRDIFPYSHSPIDEVFSNPPNTFARVLQLYLCRAFLDMGLQELAAIMFVRCGDMRPVRQLAGKNGLNEFFESTVRLMTVRAIHHQSEPHSERPAARHSQNGVAGSASDESIRGNIANSIPREASFWSHVEHQLGLLNKYDSALDAAGECFRRSISLNPNYCHPRLEMTSILARKRCYRQAVKEFSEAVKVDAGCVAAFIVDKVCGGAEDDIIGMKTSLKRLKRSSTYKKLIGAVRAVMAFGVKLAANGKGTR
jgi:teichuronic acid biosynthesis glycosyltransferase TuaG